MRRRKNKYKMAPIIKNGFVIATKQRAHFLLQHRWANFVSSNLKSTTQQMLSAIGKQAMRMMSAKKKDRSII